MKTIILAMILASIGGTVQAQSLGQNRWCWQPASSTVMFCDYTTYQSCVSSHGKEEGTCVKGG
jgi:hypothetical protein